MHRDIPLPTINHSAPKFFRATSARSFSYGLLLFVLANLMAEAATAQVFRWGLEKDDRLGVELVQSSTAETECNTRFSRSSTGIRMEMEWHVIESDESTMTIEQVVKRVAMTIKTPAGETSTEISVDTGSDEPLKGLASDLRENLRVIIDAPASITMTRRGQITNVTLDDRLKDSIRNAASSSPLQAAFTVDGMTATFSQSLFVFPEKALAIGDSWEDTDGQKAVFADHRLIHDLTFEGTQKIDNRELDVFLLKTKAEALEQAASVDGAKDDPPPELISAEGTGKFHFDRTLGCFSTCNADSQLQSRKQYRDLVFNTTVVHRTELKITKK